MVLLRLVEVSIDLGNTFQARLVAFRLQASLHCVKMGLRLVDVVGDCGVRHATDLWGDHRRAGQVAAVVTGVVVGTVQMAVGTVAIEREVTPGLCPGIPLGKGGLSQ